MKKGNITGAAGTVLPIISPYTCLGQRASTAQTSGTAHPTHACTSQDCRICQPKATHMMRGALSHAHCGAQQARPQNPCM